MIGVIIVDYNSERFLRGCLNSLAALGRKDLAVIVVDNGGSIGAERLYEEFPGLTLLNPGANLGFAGGCNVGIEHALRKGFEYCLLLNPDTRADQDFIGPLLSAMETAGDIGMACPTILDDDEVGQIAYGGGGINWWIGRPYAVTGQRLQCDGPYLEVPFASGAAMLIRTEAIRQVGPMEEGYFLYFEDADYAQAFLRAGWKVVYIPSAAVRHAASSVTGYQSNGYIYYFARNRIRFMRRWASWPHWLIFLLFHTLVRLPGALIVFGLLRRRPGAAFAFLKGWAVGLAGR
jgi:GT2 family glycosyltransferase